MGLHEWGVHEGLIHENNRETREMETKKVVVSKVTDILMRCHHPEDSRSCNSERSIMENFVGLCCDELDLNVNV